MMVPLPPLRVMDTGDTAMAVGFASFSVCHCTAHSPLIFASKEEGGCENIRLWAGKTRRVDQHRPYCKPPAQYPRCTMHKGALRFSIKQAPPASYGSLFYCCIYIYTRAVSFGSTPSSSAARVTGKGSGLAGPSSMQKEALNRWSSLRDRSTASGTRQQQ